MYLIQIGCHTGADQFFELIEDLGDQLTQALIIDALASSVDICKQKYQESLSPELFNKIQFLNMAIVDDPLLSEVTFYFPAGEHSKDGDIKYTAFSSTNQDHLISHGVILISNKVVPAITLEKLIAEHDFPKVDRLYLDAEGLDAKILLSTPTEKIDIPFLCFESTHTDGVFRKGEIFRDLRQKLKDNGYMLYSFYHTAANEGYNQGQVDWNVWAIKDDSLIEEMVKFSGHQEKVANEYSRLIKI